MYGAVPATTEPSVLSTKVVSRMARKLILGCIWLVMGLLGRRTPALKHYTAFGCSGAEVSWVLLGFVLLLYTDTMGSILLGLESIRAAIVTVLGLISRPFNFIPIFSSNWLTTSSSKHIHFELGVC